jgi:hypothetical protein
MKLRLARKCRKISGSKSFFKKKVIRLLKTVKSVNKKIGRSKRCSPTSSKELGEGVIEVTTLNKFA